MVPKVGEMTQVVRLWLILNPNLGRHLPGPFFHSLDSMIDNHHFLGIGIGPLGVIIDRGLQSPKITAQVFEVCLCREFFLDGGDQFSYVLVS